MSDVVASYLVKRICGGQVLGWVLVLNGHRSPRRAVELALESGQVDLAHFNPEEDYFRVVDDGKTEWFYGYRDGKLTRLLRPPVSPGSLPPSP